MQLSQPFIEDQIKDNKLQITWLGQAGYLIKISNNRIIAIDPYISDYCERVIGLQFKRIVPSLFTIEEFNNLSVDAICITHHHEDHLDIDLIKTQLHSDIHYYGSPTAMSLLKDLSISEDRLTSMQEGDFFYYQDDFQVHAIFADHGESAKDAIGFVIEHAGKVICHLGDTCLVPAELKKIAERWNVDLLIAPINGQYGNMNDEDAIVAMEIIAPRLISPCHYWMLPGNSGGDLLNFINKVMESNTELKLFQYGETIYL